jgi:CRP-like cAMP-binding protein
MSVSNQPHRPTKNQLLLALSASEYERLVPYLEQVELPLEKVLYEASEPITHVYFPENSIVSLVCNQLDGSTIEAGLVGSEGMVGLPVIWGGNTTITTAFVQVANGAFRMKAEQLQAEFLRGGELQSLLLRYTQALFTQVTQTAACNRLHRIEERLARWLLMVSDRVQSETFPLTQEFIAQMLGCRRSGVTVAAGILSQAGMINYKRGNINILNRQDLEATSCECYSIIKNEYARLLSIQR